MQGPHSLVRNLAVGVAFLGSLAILGGVTLLISSISLFEEVQALEVRFPRVDNLQEGDDVLLHGFRVGQVGKIVYEPWSQPAVPILVRCDLPRNVIQRLGAGTRFTVHSAGPLGGRFIEIAPGDPLAGEAPGKGFIGEAPGDLFTQLEKLVETNQKSITEAVDSIRAIVQDIDAGRGLIGQLIQDPVLAADFEAAVSEVREIFRSINAGEGTIGALVKDQDLRDRVSSAVADLADVIAGLKREDGTVGLLLNNRQARDDVAGTLSKLHEIVTEVREGKGLAARLIHSEELAGTVEQTLAKAQEVVDKVNSGSGTIGQLINNPRAWEEIVKLLILAREAIEDLREQAPISTFVNALFATF